MFEKNKQRKLYFNGEFCFLQSNDHKPFLWNSRQSSRLRSHTDEWHRPNNIFRYKWTTFFGITFVGITWRIVYKNSDMSIINYLITQWRRVLLQKLTGPQLVKKFPSFYGTRIFITAFASARHLSISKLLFQVPGLLYECFVTSYFFTFFFC
jgi:hypothetical protein